MSAFTKFYTFAGDLGAGSHNLSTATLKVMLTDTLPAAATATTTANITEIAAGNGYTAGGNAVPSSAFGQSGGIGTLTGNAVTWTASGGAIAQFRYAVLYDSTNSKLIGYWDYGAEVNVTAGNSFTVNENGQATGGTILTIQ